MTLERVSEKKSDTPFLEQPSILLSPLFGKILKTKSPLYRKGGSNYGK